jgi:hypothetical protein
MMKIWLIAVMIVLAFVAIDITVRIGWNRFVGGIGSLTDGQRRAEQLLKQPADVKNTSTDRAKTPKHPTQTVPGAVSWPGDTASYQENRGYKDFAWGDSVLKVKSRVPDLESRFSMAFEVPLVAAYIYQYWYLYESNRTWIPNPLEAIEGKIDTFSSESLQTYFDFLEGKLFAVLLFFDSLPDTFITHFDIDI